MDVESQDTPSPALCLGKVMEPAGSYTAFISMVMLMVSDNKTVRTGVTGVCSMGWG